MCSKIIFFVATLYVVNASVITYNDGSLQGLAASEGDTSSLRSCNPQECDQRCRSLKFPGGACVRGRCKCDLFRDAGDAVSENVEPKDSSRINICRPQSCDRLCRLMFFKSGTCSNGICKCSRKEAPTSTTQASTTEGTTPAANNKSADDETSNLLVNEDDESQEDNIQDKHQISKRAKCYTYKCNDSCIRVGYSIGMCKKHNKCKCY